jgi:hypothetical protein
MILVSSRRHKYFLVNQNFQICYNIVYPISLEEECTVRSILAAIAATLLGLFSAGCSEQTIVEAEAKVAPSGPVKDAGLAFLKNEKPEDAVIGGQPAPDGRSITITALHDVADTLNQTVPASTYIACNPDGTGAIAYIEDLVVLQTDAVKVGG